MSSNASADVTGTSASRGDRLGLARLCPKSFLITRVEEQPSLVKYPQYLGTYLQGAKPVRAYCSINSLS